MTEKIHTFFENHKVKAVESLIESIDNGEHNDVEIILDDGVIRASKLILSSRSEYFQKMFDKKSQFVEQKQNSAKFSCKKRLMMKIIAHIYGGELLVSDLTCLEIIEMMDMLRLLLLLPTYHVLKSHIYRKIFERDLSIRECLEAVEIAHSLKFERITQDLVWHLIINMDHLADDYVEDIGDLSKEIIVKMFTFLHKIEAIDKFSMIPCVEMYKEISKLKIVQHWAESNREDVTEELKQTLFQCFDLTNFSVEDLLGDVRKSKFFSDEEVFEAVKTVHKKAQDKIRELESNRN